MIPVFSPLTGLAGMVRSLFSAGEPGVWYDPSDLSTLFQDAAGSAPVTAVGQPVGKILDKSGRGNHATQATTASRPTLQQAASGKYYLSFDGVDDWLLTSSINFTLTDKMTVLAGVRKLSDAALSIIIEHGNPTILPDYNNSPTTMLGASSRSVDPVNGASYSSVLNSGIANANVSAVGIAIYKAPITSIISIRQDRTKTHGSEEIKFRHNAVDISGIVVANNNPTGNYGNFPLYIGRRGGTTNPFAGNLYGLIVRGAATDDLHLTHAEKFLAHKSGVTL